MTIGTVTEKKQPDNKYVEGDEVIIIKELRVLINPLHQLKPNT